MTIHLSEDRHTYSYISVEDQYRQNAYRHEFRGYNWLELGYDDRAKGSFRKAKENYEKAEALMLDGLIAAILKPILIDLETQIFNLIEFGTPIIYYMEDGNLIIKNLNTIDENRTGFVGLLKK